MSETSGNGVTRHTRPRRGTSTAAGRRLRRDGWPIAQAAVAAGVAWFLADTLVDAPQTIFAPFAAIVALLGGTGGRGRRALQVIAGVTVGVAVGELLVGLVGPGAGPVVLAAAVAMTLVSVVLGGTLPTIHGGIAAVIVVAMDDPASGWGRLASALLGGAVALLCTQVLCTPSPVRLLGAAVSRVLRAGADLLEDPAAGPLGDLPAALTALDDARSSARSMTRHTVRGRRERRRVAELDARAAQLPALAVELLGRVDGPHGRPGRAGELRAEADLIRV